MNKLISYLNSVTKRSSLLALTVDSHHMTAARVIRDHNGCRMTKSLTVSLPGESFTGDPKPAGIALAAALRGADIREKHCVVCVPPSWLLSAPVPLPDLEGEALTGFLNLRAEQEFPLPAADLHCAHSLYETSDGRHATLAALPDKRMQALKSLLQAAGLTPLSLSPGLNAGTDSDPAGGHLGFLVVDGHVNVVVFTGSGVAELRSLAADAGTSGGDLHFDANTLDRELRITLGRLPVPVRGNLREALFTGTPAEVAQVRQAVTPALERLGIRVQTKGNDPNLAGAAVTAAQRCLCGLPVTFEFIPPKQGRLHQLTGKLSAKGPRRVALVAGAAILFLTAATWSGRALLEKHLSRQWQSMSAEVAELEDMQTRIRRFRPWTDTRADSLEILNLVTGTFPDSGVIWVSRLEIDEQRKVSVAGFSKGQEPFSSMRRDLLALPQVAEATLEQQRGNDPLQYEIGFQWKGETHD